MEILPILTGKVKQNAPAVQEGMECKTARNKNIAIKLEGRNTMAQDNEMNSKTGSVYKANQVPTGFRPHPFLPVYFCRCKTLSEIVNKRQRLTAASLPRKHGS